MIFILGVLLKLPWIFGTTAVVSRPQDGFLYDRLLLFIKPFTDVFPSLFGILAFLILFWQAYLLTNFINNQRLVNRPNYLPGMALMLLSSFIPEFSYFSAPLIVSLCFLISFVSVYKAQSSPKAKGLVFNSGLMLGLATMFFQPAVFFIAWSLLALALLRPFKFNEWFLMVLGLFTPYYFYLAYLFLTNQWVAVHSIIERYSFGINIEKQNPWFAGIIFLMLLPLLAGIYYINALSSKMLIQVRRGWLLFILYFVAAVVIALVNPGPGFTNWSLLLVPAAALHAFGYLNSELKLYPVISFWVTVAYIIVLQIVNI